jgi:hypothetical protein
MSTNMRSSANLVCKNLFIRNTDTSGGWLMREHAGDLTFYYSRDLTAGTISYEAINFRMLEDDTIDGETYSLASGAIYGDIYVGRVNHGPHWGYPSFTGSHINTVSNKSFHDNKFIGLIFSINPQYKYIDLNGICVPRISESLPVLELCTEHKCKRVFGVLSSLDPNVTRPTPIKFKTDYGNFNNELQSVMNSLGEGGVWICNKNGSLETGDMITSSTVPGYGILQDDDLHHSYTVGKITCDCDFSLVKEKKQQLVCSIDTSNNRTMVLSEDGNIQYEDLLDLSGNQIYGYKYMTRLLLPDGTLLNTEEEYHTRKANGEEVFIACFVGCVYYCG